MIPLDTVIHKETKDSPEMTWETLYTLLRIAAEGNCPVVCWQAPGLHPRKTLSLNQLIAHAMPVFNHIDNLHQQIAEAHRNEANAKASAEKAKQAYLSLLARWRSIEDIVNP